MALASKNIGSRLGNGRHYDSTYEGVIPNLERRHKETDSEFMRKDIERFMRERSAMPVRRSSQTSRAWPSRCTAQYHGYVVSAVDEALELIYQQPETRRTRAIYRRQIMKEITDRLGFMSNVGLNYLELLVPQIHLSGGEAQRIRLATQIGSGLQGVLYVLDEPSIGLHQRDNDRLIATLKRLRDLGNTVLVVEHDEDTIRQADYLLDIGPAAGVHGGEVVAAGTPDEVAKNDKSITGRYLSGTKKSMCRKNVARSTKDRELIIRGASRK